MNYEQVNQQMQRCETLHEIKQLLQDLNVSTLPPDIECGVISIQNLTTGDRYIGGTAFPEQALENLQEQLSTQTYPNAPLQQAWTQLGAEQFVLEVLENCHFALLEQRLKYWRDLFPASNLDCTTLKAWQKPTLDLPSAPAL